METRGYIPEGDLDLSKKIDVQLGESETEKEQKGIAAETKESDPANDAEGESTESTKNDDVGESEEDGVDPPHPYKRLVQVHGGINIIKSNIKNRFVRFFIDLFTTVFDLKWRYVVIIYFTSYIISWLIFACVWYGVMKIHKDDIHHGDENWKRCVHNVYDFPTALLFSIETQHTIGYGGRRVTGHCGINIPLLMLQSCCGVLVTTLTAGMVIVKVTLPKKRTNTVMVSKKAVICKRDGQLELLFRIADMRTTHVIEATIRALFVQNHINSKGESQPMCSSPIKMTAETQLPDDNFLFLAWPITVSHVITPDSPLWTLSKDMLKTKHFEVVVVLEGVNESTGMHFQLRTSYIPSEILWGHRLAPLVTYTRDNRDDSKYKIVFSEFNKTIPIQLSPKSAQELDLRGSVVFDSGHSGTDTEDETNWSNFTTPQVKRKAHQLVSRNMLTDIAACLPIHRLQVPNHHPHPGKTLKNPSSPPSPTVRSVPLSKSVPAIVITEDTLDLSVA